MAWTGSAESYGSSWTSWRSSKEEPATRRSPEEPAGRWLIGALAGAPIRFYQRVLSPALPRRCKYEPTCSAYALGVIRRYGVIRGLVLTVWRVLRCNPFSHGGYDPPEAQTLFRSGHPITSAQAIREVES